MCQNFLEHLDLLVVGRSYSEDLVAAEKQQRARVTAGIKVAHRLFTPLKFTLTGLGSISPLSAHRFQKTSGPQSHM